jgi:hypothetical protein
MNLRLSGVNNQLARISTELSQDMKRDSSQMRSITLLTMGVPSSFNCSGKITISQSLGRAAANGLVHLLHHSLQLGLG